MSKPQIVTEWEKSLQTIEEMSPRCCWTCSHFHKKENMCYKYKQDIPEEFQGQMDKCNDWTRQPF